MKTANHTGASLLFGFGAALIFAVTFVVESALAQGLVPEPLPIQPVPSATINQWIATDNQNAIRAHGWALWGAANSTSKSGDWPIWETWYTDTEVQAGPPSASPTALFTARRNGRPTNIFHLPRQFGHLQAKALQRFASPLSATIDRSEQVVGFNKFDATYARYIWNNNYETSGKLWNVQDGWNSNTPVTDRHVPPFPDTAIGLKPVFEVVRGPNNAAGITLLNYWRGDLTTGPQNSTNPKNPTSKTWKQCVVVNTGTGAVPPGLTCPNGGKPSGTVTHKDFYNFQLDAAEAKSICDAQGTCNVAAGDYAVLVAMHLTTREIDNWTWQTFWWNYGQPFPYGPPPQAIPAPFNSYAMCTAYSMTVNPPNSVKGKNTLCYNPYLEPSSQIPDGIHSNCMSCHGVASIGNNPSAPGYPDSYRPTAYISNSVPSDAATYFACQTTTDTSWFLAGLAGKNQGTQPPCNVPKK